MDVQFPYNGHMKALDLIARDLPVSERTLRRGVAQGLLHGYRPSPRRLVLPPAEEAYVRRHWPLLGRLRGLLRTERGVSLAVLVGSAARGDERPDSDLDLVVALRGDRDLAVSRLERRLGAAVRRKVEVIPLEAARRDPLLMADILREGRVLIDRQGLWEQLTANSRQAFAAAERAEADLLRRKRELLSRFGQEMED